MRNIITTTFITLDGVMQAPGGPDEDTSSNFKFGGWQAPIPHDPELDNILGTFFTRPFELLLGRVTYDIFASYWPTEKGAKEPAVAEPFNATKKYVVTRDPNFTPTWKNSSVITGDVAAELKKLKAMDAPDLIVWGSGNLIQTLMKEHVIDQMSVWIHPVTIGSGKRLFANGTQPATWKLVGSKVGTNGVIFASYEPAGELRTGKVGV